MTVKFDFKTLGQPFEADWPVTASVPQDGGTTQAQTFDVRFRTLTKEEEASCDQAADPQAARLRLALVDVKGETFSPELVETLLGRGYVMMALLRAYSGFVLGTPAKN